MKKIFTLFLISFSSLGQSDSLLALIKKHPQIDTVRINLLHDFVDVDENVDVWPKYNLELKNILLKIIDNPASQMASMGLKSAKDLNNPSMFNSG
jgi:hypothetical protein